MKILVTADRYSKSKEFVSMTTCNDNLNMHGRPIPVGKSDANAKAVISSITAQMGCGACSNCGHMNCDC